MSISEVGWSIEVVASRLAIMVREIPDLDVSTKEFDWSLGRDRWSQVAEGMMITLAGLPTCTGNCPPISNVTVILQQQEKGLPQLSLSFYVGPRRSSE